MSERPKTVRCAVYTRKSTENNLDLEFNSLHAQREACEAYIKSQRHAGWELIDEVYEDGGISAATLDRPDVQRLLTDLRAGKIDVVVISKIDRLTRSLLDFAKLMELFEVHSVSFVSVTQAFNTATSMGRLNLNIVMSFAQYEREIAAERVREKIAASKRRGIWTGGQVPLGYANIDKKLIIVPEEAETVRWIFGRYLELGSVMNLLRELHHSGFTTKKRQLANGRIVGGCKFGKGGLNHLLKNRYYVGEVHHQGAFYPGCHEAIIGRELFEAVQAKLKSNVVEKRLSTPAIPYLLTGYVFDGAGNRMTPNHTVKKGVRYRYYLSQAVLQARKDKEGEIRRVPAPVIEAQIERFIRDRFPGVSSDLRALVELCIARITVHPDCLEVYLKAEDSSASSCNSIDEDSIRIAWSKRPFRAPKGVASEPSIALEQSNKAKEAALRAIGKARRWVIRLTAGEGLTTIAMEEEKGERQIRLLMPLAFVPPSTVQGILENSSPVPSITELAKSVPLVWG